MRRLLPLTLLLLLASSASADWITEILDSTGETGYWTAIRLDSNGYLHIVYKDETDNALIHTWQTSSGWNSEIIDNCDASFIAMVLDSQDMPRISYWD